MEDPFDRTYCPPDENEPARESEAHSTNAAPVEWSDDPSLRFEGGWFGKTEIAPQVLGRHTLILGETGAGKTSTALLPILCSLVNYRLPPKSGRVREKCFSLLVIDPKMDIGRALRRQLVQRGERHRLVEIGPSTRARNQRIAFFEGRTGLPLNDRLQKLYGVAPPAWSAPDARSAPWVEKGKFMLLHAASADLASRRCTGESVLANAARELGLPAETCDLPFFRLFHALVKHAGQDYRWLKQWHHFLMNAGVASGVSASDCTFLANYVGAHDLIEQFNYVCMSLEIFLSYVNDPDVGELVDFDLEPHCQSSTHLSICQQVDAGNIILFSPGAISYDSTNLVGKILKTLFFRAVFSRQDKERPIGYVCDEYQRFITGDRDSGEANFLDRCRAYRCVCVLATQSIASIRHALHDTPGGDTAINVIMNNTGNKIVMRNSDPHTTWLLKTLLPGSPLGGPHIVDVRPLASLQPGEAYVLRADGEWERKWSSPYQVA